MSRESAPKRALVEKANGLWQNLCEAGTSLDALMDDSGGATSLSSSLVDSSLHIRLLHRARLDAKLWFIVSGDMKVLAVCDACWGFFVYTHTYWRIFSCESWDLWRILLKRRHGNHFVYFYLKNAVLSST